MKPAPIASVQGAERVAGGLDKGAVHHSDRALFGVFFRAERAFVFKAPGLFEGFPGAVFFKQKLSEFLLKLLLIRGGFRRLLPLLDDGVLIVDLHAHDSRLRKK